MIREDLSRNFGYLVNDVARQMRTVYDRRVRSLGLTRSQWWVLNHLFRGGPRIHSPGSTDCGDDPTPDTLAECGYSPGLCAS